MSWFKNFKFIIKFNIRIYNIKPNYINSIIKLNIKFYIINPNIINPNPPYLEPRTYC